MNLQISRNSRLNTRILSKRLPHIDRKFPLAAVLLYKPAPTAARRITKGRYIPPAHDPTQSGRQVRLDASTPG